VFQTLLKTDGRIINIKNQAMNISEKLGVKGQP